MLITITLNKTRIVARHETRDKRDVRRLTPVADEDSAENQLLQEMDEQSPDPAEAAVLAEEFERRLAALDPDLRRIALWKLDGFSNEEIAAPDKLNSTCRTVERRLARIRQLWSAGAGSRIG